MARDRPALSVIGGGLGAGKTTLIAGLLSRPDIAQTGVVVNEFGAFGVDDLLISAAAPKTSVALLQNGCVCCRPGNDLSEAVRKMIAAADAPLRRILVETSGVADLSAVIARIGADHALRALVRLDAAVAVVDATAPDDARPEHLASADRIVLTKTDLVSSAVADQLRRRLAGMNSTAPLFDAAALPPADDLFNAGLIDSRTGAIQPNRWLRAIGTIHVHDEDAIRSWVIEFAPLRWTALSEQIARMSRAAGTALLRLKGIVADRDDPRPLAIQMVRDQIYRPVRLAPEAGGGISRIVIIARAPAAPAIEAFAARLGAAQIHERD
ncbi:CobW family GTP-binding protein [Martelella soudanensis]|uniref:CobW family GTP-binding protein n=1 Tax=unclassified Martelella TaxID=2629616 RepID=UPI0015DD86E1|nr:MULTISPECIES: GTP-binding protein [unclassified Martelella]